MRGALTGLGCLAVSAWLAAVAADDPAEKPRDRAEPEAASEYAVKAAYLFNFLLFVTPPAVTGAVPEHVVIGILGEDPFGECFKEVEGKLIGDQQRALRVRRLGRYVERMDIGHCDLLFVSKSERKSMDRILAAVRGRPILTVADDERFLAAGGMIRLLVVDDRVRWEINRTALTAAGLSGSSQLFRNAVRVVGGRCGP